jgi:hypothetical protein
MFLISTAFWKASSESENRTQQTVVRALLTHSKYDAFAASFQIHHEETISKGYFDYRASLLRA